MPCHSETIEGLAERMHGLYRVELAAPAHCTGHLGIQPVPASGEFRKIFGDNYSF